MKIIRQLSTDGSWAPRAVCLLDNLPEDKLFYVSHGARHPASIYSLSLEKLGKAFLQSIETYQHLTFEHLVQTSNDLRIDNLLEKQEHLLRVQQEHLDDCFLILKTLISPTTAQKNPLFSDQYIVQNKLPGAKSFIEAIAPYRSNLKIANKLRHQQGILRGISVRPYGRLHLGYFLEAPVDNNVIGVSKDIHPDGGAFSFARDLSQRLFDTYRCSEKLCDALRAAFAGLHQIQLVEKSSQPNPLWKQLISFFSQMEENIFPTDSGKFMPKIAITESEDRMTISDERRARLQFQRSLPVTVSTVPDRYSNSFRIPTP
jgi:hypothetical protein